MKKGDKSNQATRIMVASEKSGKKHEIAAKKKEVAASRKPEVYRRKGK